MDESLQRLKARLPDLPSSGVFMTRLVGQLGRTMTAMLVQQIKPLGLSEAEFRVLTTLFAQADRGAHPTDLCASTSQSPANMSRISDALVSRDLITRGSSASDRRKMVLRITESGEELVRRLMPRLYSPIRDMFQDFSVDEQLQLIGQLKRLSANVENALAHDNSARSA